MQGREKKERKRPERSGLSRQTPVGLRGSALGNRPTERPGRHDVSPAVKLLPAAQHRDHGRSGLPDALGGDRGHQGQEQQPQRRQRLAAGGIPGNPDVPFFPPKLPGRGVHPRQLGRLHDGRPPAGDAGQKTAPAPGGSLADRSAALLQNRPDRPQGRRADGPGSPQSGSRGGDRPPDRGPDRSAAAGGGGWSGRGRPRPAEDLPRAHPGRCRPGESPRRNRRDPEGRRHRMRDPGRGPAHGRPAGRQRLDRQGRTDERHDPLRPVARRRRYRQLVEPQEQDTRGNGDCLRRLQHVREPGRRLVFGLSS